ncbi:polysaccharide biosynthesis/export family protein [Flavobacterium sp. 140616W15]|uniref:polysaccharide biosynthesis/export family protein n=1 Tax=Flavobacterium sp. 140616W15 TaxID=2478552 RepID=UPI001F5C79CC|nr:polysaccharide biosynthesis/export family protein [Flavobacterium sp. 140616W15]
MKKITAVFILFFALLVSLNMSAQDILKSKDLSAVKVDYLSDSDINKIKNQLEAKSLSIDDAEEAILSKGMSKSEFSKLKIRLDQVSKKDQKDKDPKDKDLDGKDGKNKKTEFGRKQQEIINVKIKDSINALIFGSELFDNPTLNFEPDLKLATPMNYILGPGDELQISVYGVQEFEDNIPVSVEGKITIQYVGQIAVSGMTIEAATQKLKLLLQKCIVRLDQVNRK